MRERILALLAISERPEPPPGSGEALRTFRASRRFLHYSVLAWFPKQLAALIGLLFSLAFFGAFDQPFLRAEGWERFIERLGDVEVTVIPIELPSVFLYVEMFAVVAFVGQLVFTGALLKLSWELRWYMVGDRALRIREGLWFLREQTMTIANIQTMIVRQGPVQRLFGISDLEIHTAGGGAGAGSEGESESKKSGLHVGRLRGLEDAAALRDEIHARLVRHRGAGLGDADDAEPVTARPGLDEVAGELLEEVRALRPTIASMADAARGGSTAEGE